jgi:signal peptidase I
MASNLPVDEKTEGLQSQTNSSNERSGRLRFFLDVLETILLSGILFLGINAISARIRVDGESMLPSLRTGEFVVVNRLAYKLGEPGHGDVIVFKFPRDPEQEYIKRVIGLPGDKVSVTHGRVMINDQVMEEAYIAAQPGYQGEWNVPQGTVFVLGDNRNNSSDSHNWGMVPFEDIIGKAVFVYWPPEKWGMIESPSIANAGN